MFNNVYLSEARNFTKCSFHLLLLFSEFFVLRKCRPKNERQKWTNKENWIFSLLLNRPVRSGLHEFAEDASGIVVVTHGLAVVALYTISQKKSAISYLQTCNINLVFLSLVYSSTNKDKTGKSNTSVVHGLHYVPVNIAMPDRNLVRP